MRVPLHASATDCPLPKFGIVCSNGRPPSDPMEEIESCFSLPYRRALRPIRRGTKIDVVRGDIDKVLLAEAAFGVEARGHRLRQIDRVTGLLAGHDFLPPGIH